MSITHRDQNNTKRHVRANGPPSRPPRIPSTAIAWAVPFALVLGVLAIRNAFLFSTPEYEDADMAANSILIEQARRFTLLVGNYSREHFNHPGPAFLYVQAWGESLFYDALHLVPTPWNGQLIALYALNALFAASVVAVGYGWTRSIGGAAATLAVVALFGALHPSMFSSDWMPYVYVPAYFAFVVAIASVAAGRSQDCWLAALSGWFLIHGHACFLIFVPVLAVAAVAAALWWRWREKPRSTSSDIERSLVPPPASRVRIAVAVISAVFALPIVIELALHWPGNFGKYFAYSSSAKSGGHAPAQLASYLLWFWWPHAGAWAVPVVVVAVAAVLTWKLPAGPVRRFCASLLAVDALSTLLFIAYAAVGVDYLNDFYIGYFYWSAPILAILVIALAATRLLPGTIALVAAAVAALAAASAFAVAPLTRFDLAHVDPLTPATTGRVTDPTLAAGTAFLARQAAGRPLVLRFGNGAWPAVTGLLVQAERTGVTACVPYRSWAFMLTGQFICTPAELTAGDPLYVYQPGPVPSGITVVYRLRRGIVTAGGK
ncbi:MAG TPA: hypothetical protein VHZ33_32430 [Trebonia sp.]|jgi:hypothetical protein|nr:hypothetical protein [Trebonia sp.]